MAEFYGKKWGMKKEPLSQVFYGNFFYDPKLKKISKKDPSGKKKSIFVQYCLAALQKIYSAVHKGDVETVMNLQQGLGIEFREKDLKTSSKAVLNEILHTWLPVELSLFKGIVEKLPNAEEG